MSDITTFDLDMDGSMEPSENGQWVRYEDHLAAVSQSCNCRWDGETQVQQCTLHEAHAAAIHEWAERAKTAEAKLKEQRKPLTPAEMNYIESRWDACMHGSKIAFVVRETEAAHGIKEDA